MLRYIYRIEKAFVGLMRAKAGGDRQTRSKDDLAISLPLSSSFDNNGRPIMANIISNRRS